MFSQPVRLRCPDYSRLFDFKGDPKSLGSEKDLFREGKSDIVRRRQESLKSRKSVSFM